MGPQPTQWYENALKGAGFRLHTLVAKTMGFMVCVRTCFFSSSHACTLALEGNSFR
jgi:hypothetical protein